MRKEAFVCVCMRARARSPQMVSFVLFIWNPFPSSKQGEISQSPHRLIPSVLKGTGRDIQGRVGLEMTTSCQWGGANLRSRKRFIQTYSFTQVCGKLRSFASWSWSEHHLPTILLSVREQKFSGLPDGHKDRFSLPSNGQFKFLRTLYLALSHLIIFSQQDLIHNFSFSYFKCDEA